MLTFSNQLSPILVHPPLECFPQHGVDDKVLWKSLCLCCAFSVSFHSLYLRSTSKNQNLYIISQSLMVECQRICGALFDLDHFFWKRFYQRMALQSFFRGISSRIEDDALDNVSRNSYGFSFLLPLDILSSSMNLSAFQYEMLEQSLMAMCKGFYNEEQKGISYQKKLFKDALIYAKDIPLVGYDRWISHYAQLVLKPKSKNHDFSS